MGISMVKGNEILYSKKPILLLAKYALFAAISILCNLVSQYAVNQFIEGRLAIYIALFSGTGVGLLIKYILDKKYIFFYKANSIAKDIKTFLFYTAMGIVTTAIFWGFELAFYHAFTSDSAKYWGGLIGLLIGYSVKYLLDRRIVFQAHSE